jgi:hypothetical protein
VLGIILMYLSQGTSSLKSFSENGIVTTKENVQGKLKNCGIYCVLVGYSVYHANDVYEMLNFDSKLIVNLRDIKWLNLYHTDWIAKKIPVADHINNDYDDNDIIIQRETNDVLDSSINFSYQADKPSVDVKIYRQMKQIESSFNPKASKIVDEFEQGREVHLGYASIAVFICRKTEETTTFEEAWNCKDPTDYKKWWNAIKKD